MGEDGSGGASSLGGNGGRGNGQLVSSSTSGLLQDKFIHPIEQHRVRNLPDPQENPSEPFLGLPRRG
jgi:hypothetical protein